jgi:hypothetical protein
MDKKLNCWEYKKCGREPGGARESELGLCPATIETRLNGVHGGYNAGRACWVVDGTMCDDKIGGTFTQKYEKCSICDFHIQVRRDEVHNIQLPSTLYLRLLSDYYRK